jgi:hypothetical protein
VSDSTTGGREPAPEGNSSGRTDPESRPAKKAGHGHDKQARSGGATRDRALRTGAASRDGAPRTGGASRDGAQRSSERKPWSKDGEKKPWSKDGERKPREASAGRPNTGARTGERKPWSKDGDKPRSSGARSGGEKKLWTRDGRPARNDSGARDRDRELTEEERLARELRSVRPRHDDPDIPDDVVARDLDKVARNELKTLSKENADEVARHLVMAARLIEDDPNLAHKHALSAERRAGRIGVVRETLAITAYATGDFALAIRELRTYRRITGSNNQLPLMVDSERGVGRADRALELGRSVDRETLPVEVQVSLAIAMSGARLDRGQNEAALVELEIPQLDPNRAYSWSPELFHAYADVLEELGRDDDANQWRDRAARAESALGTVEGDGEDELIDIVEEDELFDIVEEDEPVDIVQGDDAVGIEELDESELDTDTGTDASTEA